MPAYRAPPSFVARATLLALAGLLVSCASDDAQKKSASPAEAAEAPPPHRFDIPQTPGSARPLPLFAVEGVDREILLLARTRGTTATACAAPLPQAFASATRVWTLPSHRPEALLARPDLLGRLALEADEAFDARVADAVKDAEAMATWNTVLAKRDAMRARLERQSRFLEEERLAAARQQLTSHVLALTTLEAVAQGWPTLGDCMDAVASVQPLPQPIPLGDDVRSAIDERLLAAAAAPTVAAHLAAALQSPQRPPPHLGAPLADAPFIVETFETGRGGGAHVAADRPLVATAVGFIRQRAEVAAEEEQTLLWLDADVLLGDDGVLQQLLNAGLGLRQLRADAPLPALPSVKEATLEIRPLDVQTRSARVEKLDVTTVWQAPDDQPRRLQRLTGRVFSFSWSSGNGGEGGSTPKAATKVSSFLVEPSSTAPLALPDVHRLYASYPGASLISWEEDGRATFAALDHRSGEPVMLEGRSTLSEVEGGYLLLSRVDNADETAPLLWVRLGLAARPVRVEGLRLPPFVSFPDVHTIDGGVVLGTADEDSTEGCQLMKVTDGRATCIAFTYAEAKAFKDRRRGLVVQPTPPRPRGAPAPEARWVHDVAAAKRLRLPGSRWMPVPGRQYDFRTEVLVRRAAKGEAAEGALYAQGVLRSFPGELTRCSSAQTSRDRARIFCTYTSGADGEAPAPIVLANNASTAAVLPEGFDASRSLHRFAASNDAGDALLVVGDEGSTVTTGLPACAGGWRAQGRPKQGWLALSCAAPASPSSPRSLVMHLDSATALVPPAAWAFADLREDGRAVFSDAAISERRNVVTRVGVTAPLAAP
jgi:hypothetical protein